MYVVVTYHQPGTGPHIVNVYGPWSTKPEAERECRAIQRNDSDDPREGNVLCWVRQVMSGPPQSS